MPRRKMKVKKRAGFPVSSLNLSASDEVEELTADATLERLSVARDIAKEVANKLGARYKFLVHRDTGFLQFQIDFNKNEMAQLEFDYKNGHIMCSHYSGGNHNGQLKVKLGDPELIAEMVLYLEIVKNVMPAKSQMWRTLRDSTFWLGTGMIVIAIMTIVLVLTLFV